MRVHELINKFDFDTATPYDVAVLLEQVFLYHDSRSRDGGPLLVAGGVIEKFSEAIRSRSAPELRAMTNRSTRELREAVAQLDTVIKQLECGHLQRT